MSLKLQINAQGKQALLICIRSFFVNQVSMLMRNEIAIILTLLLNTYKINRTFMVSNQIYLHLSN